MRFNVKKPIVGLSLAAVVVMGMLVAASSASAVGYVRPNAATPISSALALAYNSCTAPDPATWTYGGSTTPNSGACNGDPAGAPVAASFGRTSTLLTAGDASVGAGASNFKGNVKLVVCSTLAGYPSCAATNPNCPSTGCGVGTQDVLTPWSPPTAGGTCVPGPAGCGANYLQDVRCGVGNTVPGHCAVTNAAGPPDFGTTSSASLALLKASSNIRITALGTGDTTAGCANAVGPRANCPYLGTVIDLDFDVPVLCNVTSSTLIGGFCTPAKTSINSVLPGAVGPQSDLLRANVEIKQIHIQDGGPDGNAFVTTDGANSDYAVQGIFLP